MLLSLPELTDALLNEFALTPVMAAEIECYVLLSDESAESMDAFWGPIDAAFKFANLPILRIEKERGLHQYEIITSVTTPERLIETLVKVRSLIEKQAAKQNITVTFDAKPFADQPSSGLHFHLHLADAEGINSYHKTEEWTSDTLRFSLGGLLAVMNDQMGIFFPNEADYGRLQDVDHVPKIAGWGVNNRYCALRIPMDPDPYNKRIEHRVPCANADPALCVNAMLEGVLKGLRERTEPPMQSHGKKVESV